MPSRTIRPTQAPEPAPFAYTVAAPEGFTPEAVFATWDGTGAGGPFLPCVSYYNADGVLLDRAFPTTGAVTAGDSADVGYRPFERGGGGGGTPGAALDTTDGVTNVNPTTVLEIGTGLKLDAPGGGTAIVSERAVPFVMASADTLTVPAGGSLVVDFHNVAGTVAYTNDVPGNAGYETNEGDVLVNTSAWVGDNFRGDVTDARAAFRTRPDRGGFYLFEVTVKWRVLFAAGNLTILFQVGGTALLGAALRTVMPFAANAPLEFVYALPAILLTSGGGANTDVFVALSNSAGLDSDPNVTAVRVTGYRMSPNG